MAEHVTVTVTRLRGTGREERGDMSASLGGSGGVGRARAATDSSRQLLKGSTAVKMLDMPLGTKLPPLPGCDILIYNTDFCEKVHQPSSGFNLDDPRCRLLQTEYKTLHSPHLSSYHKRKNMLRKLKKEEYITKDNKSLLKPDLKKDKVGQDIIKTGTRWRTSGAYTTLLSSTTFLEDVITKLMTNMFPPSPGVIEKEHQSSLSESAFKEIVQKLKHKVMMKIPQYGIWDKNNSNVKQYIHSQKDVQKVTESIYNNILQLYESHQAIQDDVTNSCGVIFDNLASSIIIEIYQHLQPHLAGDALTLSCSSSAENAIDEVTDSSIPTEQSSPCNLHQESSSLANVYHSTFLEDIISGLLCKIFSSSSDDTEAKSRMKLEHDLSVVAIKLIVNSLLMEITKAQIKVINNVDRVHGPLPEHKDVEKVVDSVYCDVLREYGSQEAVYTNITTDNNIFARRMTDLLLAEISDYQLHLLPSVNISPEQYTDLEADNIVQKVLNDINKTSNESEPCLAHTRKFASTVLEDVTSRLVSKFFPSSSNNATTSEDQDGKIESDVNKLASRLIQEVMLELLNHDVWCTHDETNKQYLHSQRNVQDVVDSVCSNIFEKFESQQIIQGERASGNKLLVESISRLFIREIAQFKPPLYEVPNIITGAAGKNIDEGQSAEHFSPSSTTTLEAKNIVQRILSDIGDIGKQYRPSTTDICEEQAESPTSVKAVSVVDTVLKEMKQPLAETSNIVAFSSAILEEIVVRFLFKVFSSCSNLTENIENSSLLSQLFQITEKLLRCLLIQISNQAVPIRSYVRCIHPKDRQDIEKVVDSVFSNVLQISGSPLSISKDLSSDNETLAQTIASLIIGEMSQYHFQQVVSQETSPLPASLEADYIVQKVLCDLGIRKKKNVVYEPFVEEIVSRFLNKMVSSSNYLEGKELRKMSFDDELSIIASELINAVLKELSRSEINVVRAANEERILHPEDEEFIALVVDSVYLNALQECGSACEVFKNLTSRNKVFSERIVNLIMKEISNYQLQPFFSESELQNKDYKIVCSNGTVQSPLTAGAENIVHSIIEKIADYDAECSVKIIPYIRHIPITIDSAIISEHLAVVSIKTQLLDTLKKQCWVQTGMSLVHLRKASASGQTILPKTIDAALFPPGLACEKKKEKLCFLDKAGRLDTKPNEPMCRNSFLNLGKPDITKVELLKDVQNAQDLIIRLIAHDIVHCDEDDDIDEIVLKEETSLFVKSQYLRDRLPKTKLSSILRNKDLWKSCSKCKCKCSPCCKSKIPSRGPIPTLQKSTSKLILEILPESDSQKEESPSVVTQITDESIPRCVLVPSLHRSEATPSIISKEKQISLEESSTASHLTLLYKKLYEDYFDSAMYKKGKIEDTKLKPALEDISFRQLSLQSSTEGPLAWPLGGVLSRYQIPTPPISQQTLITAGNTSTTRRTSESTITADTKHVCSLHRQPENHRGMSTSIGTEHSGAVAGMDEQGSPSNGQKGQGPESAQSAAQLQTSQEPQASGRTTEGEDIDCEMEELGASNEEALNEGETVDPEAAADGNDHAHEKEEEREAIGLDQQRLIHPQEREDSMIQVAQEMNHESHKIKEVVVGLRADVQELNSSVAQGFQGLRSELQDINNTLTTYLQQLVERFRSPGTPSTINSTTPRSSLIFSALRPTPESVLPDGQPAAPDVSQFPLGHQAALRGGMKWRCAISGALKLTRHAEP